jgi:DNA-binding NtrC family response regulator
VGNVAPSVQKRILTELARAGLAIEADPPRAERAPPAGSCLVLFDRLTGEVLEELRAAEALGRHRVLAIALPGTSLGSSDTWSLLRHGASDVVRWDDSNPPACDVIARLQRWAEVDRMLRSAPVRHKLIGDSSRWTALLRQVVEVAAFTPTSILLTGESGTGKELVAHLIHDLDSRPDKGSLVVLDCTTVVPTLSGSEFFGHERGAFTGAVAARDGAFARADRGTLFLDEIGELPLPLQAELLRAIQEGMYKRVGSDTWRDTQFRLVCATNRSLEGAVERGQFRSDLYYRIAAFTCELPPLRERRDDILPLATHFLGEMFPALGRPVFDPAVTEFLARREYPGNVRELRLLMARIAARHVGQGPITVGSLPDAERPGTGGTQVPLWWQGPFEQAIGHAVSIGVGLREIGRVAQQTAVQVAVTAERGNLRRASRLLGVTERALQLRRSSGDLGRTPGAAAAAGELRLADGRSTGRPDQVPAPDRGADDDRDGPLPPAQAGDLPRASGPVPSPWRSAAASSQRAPGADGAGPGQAP